MSMAERELIDHNALVSDLERVQPLTPDAMTELVRKAKKPLKVVSLMCGSGLDHNQNGWYFNKCPELYRYGSDSWVALDEEGNIHIVTDGPGSRKRTHGGGSTGDNPSIDKMVKDQTEVMGLITGSIHEMNIRGVEIGLPNVTIVGFSRGAVAAGEFSRALDEGNCDLRSSLLIQLDAVAGERESLNYGERHLVNPKIRTFYQKSLDMNALRYISGFGPTEPISEFSGPHDRDNVERHGVVCMHGGMVRVYPEDGATQEDYAQSQRSWQEVLNVVLKNPPSNVKNRIARLSATAQRQHLYGMYNALLQEFEKIKKLCKEELHPEPLSNAPGDHDVDLILDRLRETGKPVDDISINELSIDDLTDEEVMRLAQRTALRGWGNSDVRRQEYAVHDFQEYARRYIQHRNEGEKFSSMPVLERGTVPIDYEHKRSGATVARLRAEYEARQRNKSSLVRRGTRSLTNLGPVGLRSTLRGVDASINTGTDALYGATRLGQQGIQQGIQMGTDALHGAQRMGTSALQGAKQGVVNTTRRTLEAISRFTYNPWKKEKPKPSKGESLSLHEETSSDLHEEDPTSDGNKKKRLKKHQ